MIEVWYCKRCKKLAKSDNDWVPIACKCEKPLVSIKPTQIWEWVP